MIRTTIAGVVVMALLSAAGWYAWEFYDRGLRACDAKWELKLKAIEEENSKAIASTATRMKELESQLVAAKNVADKIIIEEKTDETSNDRIPLSDACAKCRIPNNALWMRRGG